ncbi:MAG TPA: hypothetical protein VGN16_04650 [Acidobacteriaceae bacterium]
MKSASGRYAVTLSVAFSCVAATSLHAQSTPAPAPAHAAASDTRIASTPHVPEDMLQGLQYRMIGPHRGGRSTAVSGIPGDHRTFYMGATGGGVWKTTDGGDVWENISDGYFKTGAVGAIAVAVSDPKVIYVGTGSASIRNNIEIGRGMYKSTDAGATWSMIGLEDAGQIARVRIDPRDPNHVYVAAVGHAFGNNAERGIFRSRDGGKTWEKSLFVNESTGAVDLVMAADNPNVLYASMWTGARHPWGMVAGSTDGGIYKTTDGGDHWTKLTQGLPKGAVGKIGVTVSPVNPKRVWALIDAVDGGMFRSDDAGKTFTLISPARNLLGRSWYYAHIFADTQDADTVYAANTDFFKSTDGGKTFNPLAMPHGDNHDLWIDPKDPLTMIEANDGGATISVDGGKTWSTQLNQPTAEIYRIVADDQVPYRVYGTQQDQYDGLSLPSRSAHFGERLQLQHWYTIGGMEGGFVAVVPKNPNIVYSGGPGGMTTRIDLARQHLRSINVNAGMRGGDLRFAWDSPIFISPLEPDAVYHTSNFVHKTVDGGQTWKTISPDLTRNDKTHQGVGTGPGSEAESYPTVSTFAEAVNARGVLWAGSDDGLVHLSRDGGLHWLDVTPKGMPEFSTVNTVEPSPYDPARAFLAVYRYMLDDYHPYIYRTNDYGHTWSLLTDGTNGIPADQPVRVVREDPVRKGLLYAGTEYGMFVSLDDGKHWQPLQLNLPATPVTDIVIHDSDLAISTNGRSFWILDDISPLRQLAVQTFEKPHLYPVRPTYRIATAADEDDQPYIGGPCCVSNVRDLYTGARIERHQLGTEPPEGAIVYASFPDKPTERVTLTVTDTAGKLLRTLVDTGAPGGPAIHAGLNRFNWDFAVESRSPGTPKPAQRGPKAVPGTYQFHLTVGSGTQSATLKLQGDPKAHITQGDYQAQFDLLTRIEDDQAQIRKAGATIRERRAGLPAASPELAKLDALQTSLGIGLERGAGRRAAGNGPPPLIGELTSLYTFVSGSEDRPTGAALERYRDIHKSLTENLARLHSAQ